MSREVLKRKLKEWICKKNPPKDIKILDVGCGDGSMLELLQKEGFTQLYGCDFAKSLENEKITYKQVDLNIQEIPFNEKFDLVFCIEVIEHLENPYKLISDLHKVTKENGILMLTKPHATNFWNRLTFLFTGNVIRFHLKNNHITFTTPDTFTKLIDGRFKIIKTGTEFGVLPILRIKYPTPFVLFGNTLIYELKRIDVARNPRWNDAVAAKQRNNTEK